MPDQLCLKGLLVSVKQTGNKKCLKNIFIIIKFAGVITQRKHHRI